MTNTKVFQLSTVGSYPFEKYQAKPITFIGGLPLDFTSINWNELDGSGSAIPSNGSLITKNYLNYHKNPLNQLLSYSNPYYKIFIKYNNVNFNKYSTKFQLFTSINDTQYIENVSTITLYNFESNYSSLVLDISSVRKNFKTPYEFYFFYVQLNDITKNSYGYMLYPNRIFLKPKSITKVNNKWQLKTNIKLISATEVHIQSTEIEKDAFNLHKTRLNSLPPNIINIPDTLDSNKVYFDIYGNITKVSYPAVDLYNSSIVPKSSSFYLETDIAYINPDSTFVSFSSIYTDIDNNKNIISQNSKNDSYSYQVQYFNPTHILEYDPSNYKQTYQLLQTALNPNLELARSENCVLSADFNLNSGLFNFYNYNTRSAVKFNSKFPLKIDYIADCYKLKTINVSASSTLTNSELSAYDGLSFVLKQPISSSCIINDISSCDILWETDYPPYCYSYKMKITDNSDNYLDSNGLNFYLKLNPFYQDTTSVKLSAFFVSDFNELTVPVESNDLIRFSIESTSLANDYDFIDKIVCTYGDDNNQIPYNIKDSSIFSASPDKYLKISYNNVNFQGLLFSIKASLTSYSGQIDTFESTNVQLFTPNFDNNNKLFIDVFAENSNEIIIDGSANVSSIDWPNRDLTNSKILWFYGGNDKKLSLNYVDTEGNFIKPITGEDIFDSTTWRIKLSGYGPILTSISLSSQKYNQVSTLSTNPNLYDFLSEGKIKVGVLKQLDNLNKTRTIELTAAIPYGDRLFNIPKTIPINWTWEYDEIQDPTLQPISVIQTLNNNIEYVYSLNDFSTILSAIKVNVVPEYSKLSPKNHKVKIIANIDVVQPSITGFYSFNVDDFPDPSIFNCDFQTYYTAYSSNPNYKIADTREDQNTITRSENSVLNLTFSANSDVLPYITNATLNWNFDNVKKLTNEYIYKIDLTDPLSGLSPKILNNIKVSSCDISLNLYSGYAPGWTSAHNVSATTHIFILSSIDFYKPLKFIIYPEYAWLNNDNDYTLLTFLSTDPDDASYFTNSYAPSAYLNKKSGSQTFWVSANKNHFEEYFYQNKENYSIVTAPSSYYLIDLPYSFSDITVARGLPISLIAYNNNFYPENINLKYIDQIYDIIDTENKIITQDDYTYLVSNFYKITSQTIDGYRYNLNGYDKFFTNPIFRPYNDALLVYTPYCNNELVSSLNITELSGGIISINQYIETSPTLHPAKIVNGSIVYYLSCLYWTISSVVNVNSENVGVSSYYDLFNIKYGDPAYPSYAGELGLANFYFYAEPKLVQKIPPTTFDNYLNTSQYPVNPDLWEGVNLS
jgi:hypothetical protein